MTRRAAIYLRVSTDGQTTDNQRRELEQVAARAGWEVVEIYEDAGISGAKGRDQRPAFDRLAKDAARRRFDVVMAWSVDRLGRSLRDLLAFLEELQAINVDLFLHKQGIDTTTPSSRMMFQMCGVFSEFERSMIVDRVKAGLARVREESPAKRRAEGKKAIGRPRVDDAAVVARVAELKASGMGILKIAKTVGVGTSVVQRLVADQHA